MLISFTDRDGVRGVITKDLVVDYQGRWEREVEVCVSGLKEEFISGEKSEQIKAFANNLMLDLPEAASLHEIEREPMDEISLKR